MDIEMRARKIRDWMTDEMGHGNLTDAVLIAHLAAELRAVREEAIEWKVKELLSEPYMMAHFSKGRDEGIKKGLLRAAEITEQEAKGGYPTSFFIEKLAERIRKEAGEL